MNASHGEIKDKKLARDWTVLSLDYQKKRKLKTKKGGADMEVSNL